MALMRSRKCRDCGTAYSVLEHRGEILTVESDDDRDTCPKCASNEYEEIVTAGTGIELGGEASYGKIYPYFDRGLGCRVSSAKHRRQLMKERGLQPLGGADLQDMAQKNTSAREERKRRLAARMDEYENHPDFAEYRKLRARGAFKGAKPNAK